MNYALSIVCACLMFVSTAFAGGDAAGLYAKACKGCHGADGAKVAMGMTKALKDMSGEDVKAALAGYKAGTYGGEKKAMMERVVKPLSDEELDNLADYVSGL